MREFCGRLPGSSKLPLVNWEPKTASGRMRQILVQMLFMVFIVLQFPERPKNHGQNKRRELNAPLTRGTAKRLAREVTSSRAWVARARCGLVQLKIRGFLVRSAAEATLNLFGFGYIVFRTGMLLQKAGSTRLCLGWQAFSREEPNLRGDRRGCHCAGFEHSGP